ISFVQRKRLDQISVIVENLLDFLRNFFVSVKTRFDKNDVRTIFLGENTAERTSDTKFPRLITRCRNHSAGLASSNSNGLSAQLGIVELLHRCVKSVHVDVDNPALGFHSVKGIKFVNCKGAADSFRRLRKWLKSNENFSSILTPL